MLNLPIKILQTQQIETEQATITFADIDDLVAQWDAVARVTSRHLVVIINGRSPEAVNDVGIFYRLNGDSGNNYNEEYLQGYGAVDDAGIINAHDHGTLGVIPGTSYAGAWGGGMSVFPHAFNTVNHKVLMSLSGSAEHNVQTRLVRWASAAAITSILLWPSVGNFAVGSTFSVGVVDERYLVEEIEDAAGDFLPAFDNIPQGEGDLVIVGYARSARVNPVDNTMVIINDDSVDANYARQYLQGSGGGRAAAQANDRWIARSVADNALANVFGGMVISLSQYTKGDQPHYLSLSGYHDTTAALAEIFIYSGRRNNTEPVNKIEILQASDFMAGSLFSLYRVPKRIIERIELTEDTATITFDNIPQNFEALMLSVYARSDVAAVADDTVLELNDDAVAANYNAQRLAGIGAGVTATRLATANNRLCAVPGDNEGINEFAGGMLLFSGYAKTDRHKSFIILVGINENSLRIFSGRWQNTNAITKLELTPENGTNFLAGSIFELEGILKKEG